MKSVLKVIFIRGSSLVGFFWLRLKKVKITYSNNTIIKGLPFVKNKGQFHIYPNVTINSLYRTNPIGGSTFCTFVIEENAELLIDEGARISNITINCKENIYIGKNVFVGGDTKIYDSDFHSLHLSERLKEIDTDIKKAPVKINDGAFIGASVLILKGVEIGENSIIGARSVVTKNIPKNEIWAGNPAKFIRTIIV